MKSVEKLISCFEKFPGVGRKTAERFAFHILGMNSREFENFKKSVEDIKCSLSVCSLCEGYGESDPCAICSDARRNRALLCIVEHEGARLTIEKTNAYDGIYYVLGGHLTPSGRETVASARVKKLLERIENPKPEEIILATAPSAEGETTAACLMRILKPLGLTVSRIGLGLPVGSELEYADGATIVRAFDGRRKL